MKLSKNNKNQQDNMTLRELYNECLIDNDEKSSGFFKKTGKVGGFFTAVGVVSLLTAGLIVPPTLLTAGIANASTNYWNSLESELSKDEIPLAQQTVLLDKDGKKFAQFHSENRRNITYKQIPDNFKNALIATEDARFWENNGFDPIGLARSFVSTTSGGQKQGASGLTQQLVKNLQLLNAETDEEMNEVKSRTVETKLQELKYSIHLADKYDKEKILEMYTNTVYFGNGAYGLAAASKTYFDKTPDKLTYEEAATLVGVINNPTIYDPFKNPENSTKRRNIVLKRAETVGAITNAEYKKYSTVKMKPIKGKTNNGCSVSSYPYYCQLVKREILSNPAYGATKEIREKFLYLGGVTLTTALDTDVTKKVQKEVSKAFKDTNRVANAVTVMKPGTGQVIAVAQNRKFGNGKGKTEIIYSTAKRQTGSSFKPLVMATGLENGLSSRIQRNSDSFYKPGGWEYPKPRGFSNFGYANYGNVDGYQATRQSLNVWYVRLAQDIGNRTGQGVKPIAEFANRIGLSIPLDDVHSRGLSIALGAREASTIEMATAYSTFAANGIKCDPVTIIDGKVTSNGKKIKISDPNCEQKINGSIATEMNKILQQPFNAGGTLSMRPLDGRQVAGKTGTTNGQADAWTVGYTPQYVMAVWTGDPRGGSKYPLTSYVQYGRYSNNGTGAYAAGPVWQASMKSIHAGLPKLKFSNKSNGFNAITSNAVPDVRGLPTDVAIATLIDAGYVPQIEKDTAKNDKIVKDTVVEQNPNGGTTGENNSVVKLTLSKNSKTDYKLDIAKLQKERG